MGTKSLETTGVMDLQDKDCVSILCYKLQGVEKYGLPDSDFPSDCKQSSKETHLLNVTRN